VIILHILEPFASGVVTAVSSIIRELPEFTHIVIHGSRNSAEEAEKAKERFPTGTSFVQWKYAAREISLINDYKALRELKVILKRYKAAKNPFVVHLHSSKAGFLGRFACMTMGIKSVIYTPHCGAFLRTDIGFIKRKMYRFFEKLGGWFGGRVVGCGQGEGEIYKKLGRNTCYVNNGIALKKSNKPFDARNLISFTGIATFQKDPVLWNRVAELSFENVKKAGFSFCWIGAYANEGTEKLNDCVTVTGWKTAKEVEELLDKTAIYFSASAWEGLPYGVLEAMGSSCALLLRDVPGNRELVLEGENGFLFKTAEEAADRLNVIFKDKSLLSKMGKKSREIVEQSYTLKQMGEGYRQIYLSAVEGDKK
jgi:glycosyltransferase involved in cell wall biosynthesis